MGALVFSRIKQILWNSISQQWFIYNKQQASAIPNFSVPGYMRLMLDVWKVLLLHGKNLTVPFPLALLVKWQQRNGSLLYASITNVVLIQNHSLQKCGLHYHFPFSCIVTLVENIFSPDSKSRDSHKSLKKQKCT